MVWGQSQTSFFYMWLSSCPSTICWHEYFLPLNALGTIVENHLTYLYGFISEIKILFLWSCQRHTVYCLDYHCFAVSFEIGKCGSFVLLFQDWFCFSVSLAIPYEFLKQLFIVYREVSQDSDKNRIESVDNLGEYCHLKYIMSSNPWIWGIFQFIYNIINFFQLFCCFQCVLYLFC